MRRRSLFAVTLVAATQLIAQTDTLHHARGGMRVLVSDAAAGGALWGAEVELPTLEVKFAVPDNGMLLIRQVPPGLYVLQVRRIGYAMQTRLVRVRADTPSVRFALDRAAVALDTVNVVAPENSAMRDFERRLRAGNGRFFTASDIEKSHAQLLTQFLATVHGVKLRPTSAAYSERSPMAVAESCPSGVLVFLDGVAVNALEGSDPSRPLRTSSTIPIPRTAAPPSSTTTSNAPATGGHLMPGATAVANAAANSAPNPIRESAALPPFDLNAISLSQIGAMEVYPDGAPAQMPYGDGSRCGVVLLWSKAK